MNEIIALLAVISAGIGAGLSTWKGYEHSPPEEKYNKSKLASSLIISVVTSFSLVNFTTVGDQLSALGYVGLAVTYLLIGLGTDQGLSHLDSR
jgi:hypothetical protein